MASEKESFETAQQVGDVKKREKAPMFAAAASASAKPAGQAPMEPAGGYYQQATQKGKLILPTAIWILIVVAGLCFLSLLSSLNKTINTLDSLVEIEQASAKLEEKQARDIEHHLRHHHNQQPFKYPPSDRPMNIGHNLKGEWGPSSWTSMFAMPSWTSLEPVRPPRPSVAQQSSSPLEGMMSLMGLVGDKQISGSANPDGDLVSGTVIITSSNDAADGFKTRDQSSPMGSLLKQLFSPPAPSQEVADRKSQPENGAGFHLTANIDNLNLNLGGDRGEQPYRESEQEQGQEQEQERQVVEQVLNKMLGGSDQGAILVPLMAPPPLSMADQQHAHHHHRGGHHRHHYHKQQEEERRRGPEEVLLSADSPFAAPYALQHGNHLPPLGWPVNPPSGFKGFSSEPQGPVMVTLLEEPTKPASQQEQEISSVSGLSDELIRALLDPMMANQQQQQQKETKKDEEEAKLMAELLASLQSANAVEPPAPAAASSPPQAPQEEAAQNESRAKVSKEEEEPIMVMKTKSDRERKNAEASSQLMDMMSSIFSLPAFGGSIGGEQVAPSPTAETAPMKTEAQSKGEQDSTTVANTTAAPPTTIAATANATTESTTTITTTTSKPIAIEKVGAQKDADAPKKVAPPSWLARNAQLLIEPIKWDLDNGEAAKPEAVSSGQPSINMNPTTTTTTTTSTTTTTTEPPTSKPTVAVAAVTTAPPPTTTTTTGATVTDTLALVKPINETSGVPVKSGIAKAPSPITVYYQPTEQPKSIFQKADDFIERSIKSLKRLMS